MGWVPGAHRDGCQVLWSLPSDIRQVPSRDVFVAMPSSLPLIFVSLSWARCHVGRDSSCPRSVGAC